MHIVLNALRKMTPLVRRIDRLFRAHVRLIKTLIALMLAMRVLIALIVE